MKNIVILISGGGSNMATIVKTAQQEQWEQRHGARVAAVVSNKADAKGLVFARAQGIATAVLDHKAFASREAFDAELAATIARHTARACTVARTSCTRSTRAPRSAASTAATTLGSRRSPTSSPVTAPSDDLRDQPASSG